MKIIHTADLHLDSKLSANLSSDKTKARKLEILSNFRRLLSTAKNMGVKAVIIAGDLFDNEKITKYAKGEVLSVINAYSDIDIIYLVGNHEKTAFLDTLSVIPENLKAVTSSAWETVKYDGITISLANLTEDNEGVIYKTLNLEKDDKNIVVLHGAVANYKSSNHGETVNIPELKDKNIDYLALGHYHSFLCEKLDERGNYAYSGCLEGRGFDECGQKGFVLIDTDDIKKVEFVPFSKRVLHEITLDVSGFENWAEIKKKVLLEVLNIDKKDLVKVVLKGEIGKDVLTYADNLATELNYEFYFAKVYDETEVKINEEDIKSEIGIKGEFYRLLLNDETITKSDKTEIVKILNKALKGEDL